MLPSRGRRNQRRRSSKQRQDASRSGRGNLIPSALHPPQCCGARANPAEGHNAFATQNWWVGRTKREAPNCFRASVKTKTCLRFLTCGDGRSAASQQVRNLKQVLVFT